MIKLAYKLGCFCSHLLATHLVVFLLLQAKPYTAVCIESVQCRVWFRLPEKMALEVRPPIPISDVGMLVSKYPSVFACRGVGSPDSDRRQRTAEQPNSKNIVLENN